MLTTTRRLAAVLVLPFVLTLAACGTSDAPAPATTPSAPTTTTPAAPKRLTSGAELTAALTASAKTVKSAHFVGGDGTSDSLQGDAKVAGDASDLKVQLTQDGTTMEALLIGDTLYLKGLPDTPADKWTKLKETDLGGMAGIFFGMFRAMDPVKLIDSMGDDLEKVTYVAQESVAGVDAAKYDVVVKKGTKTQPFEVWLDGANRPVKVSGPDDQGKVFVVSFSKFDEPVEIVEPPAKDVIAAPGS